MQISATYLDWPTFSKLADGDFEECYWEYAESDDGEVPGEVPVDDADSWSDSYFAWEEASEYLDEVVEAGSSWRPFVEHGFLAVIHGEPEPRNDLGVAVDPELFAAILSPDSVREIMKPTMGQDVPWADAPPERKAEIERWYNIWRKAAERGLGIAYHLG